MSLGVGNAWSVEEGLFLHVGVGSTVRDHDKESQKKMACV